MAAVAMPTVFEVAGQSVDLSGIELPGDVHIQHEVPERFADYEDKRAAGTAIDATVVVKTESFPAHRDLLVARIPFFNGLFNSKMKESTTGVIDVSEFDPEIISSLVDYSYTGRITITDVNVQDLLMGASFLGIESVMDECAQFMRKRVRVANALPMFAMCRSIGYDKIDDVVLRFIDKNFVPISSTQEFLNAGFDVVENILHRSSLYIDSETQVFEAATRWMAAKAEARAENALKVLRAVRCTHLTVQYIEDVVEKAAWVAGSEQCLKVAAEAKAYITNPDIRHELNSFNTDERKCDDTHNLIFPVGNLSNVSAPKDSSMSLYDPITNTWKVCQNLPQIRGRNGVAVVDRKIYSIGGFNAKDRLDSVDIFDTETNQWLEVGASWKLSHQRSAMATGVINGRIIIAGGYDGTQSMKSVEMINPADDEPAWRSLEEMSKERGAPASCVFNGKLYVIGGHDGQQIFKDGEYYDPATNTWTEIAPMKYKRCRFGIAVLNGLIYAVGGFNGAEFLRDVERYDPSTNTWVTLKQAKTRRSRATVAVSCGKLYVFGGFDGLNNISTVEMYQQETDNWVKREDMPAHSGGIFVGTLAIPTAYASPVANLEEGDIEEMEETN